MTYTWECDKMYSTKQITNNEGVKNMDAIMYAFNEEKECKVIAFPNNVTKIIEEQKREIARELSAKETEVEPIRNVEDIKKIIKTFDDTIASTSSIARKKIAERNKLCFIMGINIGLRGSDLVSLKWKDIFDDEMNFREGYKIKPKKTEKKKKLVQLHYNETFRRAVNEYIGKYPIKDMNDFVFSGQKGSDTHIRRDTLGDILKDACKKANINIKVNTHSLRKTFGYRFYMMAEDKQDALVYLQLTFNHSSPLTTMAYIGVTFEKQKTYIDDIGFEY